MTEQLTLIAPEPPKLKPRQALVLDAVTRAGHDGLTDDEAGALAHTLKEGDWAHGPDARCDYCARDGHSILKALEAKGLVTYRRKKRNVPGGWIADGLTPQTEVEKPSLVPYNEFPEGF